LNEIVKKDVLSECGYEIIDDQKK